MQTGIAGSLTPGYVHKFGSVLVEFAHPLQDEQVKRGQVLHMAKPALDRGVAK